MTYCFSGCFQRSLSLFGFQQFDSDVWFSLYLLCLGFTWLPESLNLCLLPNLVTLGNDFFTFFVLFSLFFSVMASDIVLLLSGALFTFYLYPLVFQSGQFLLTSLLSPSAFLFPHCILPGLTPTLSCHASSFVRAMGFLRGQSSVLCQWGWGRERMKRRPSGGKHVMATL